jgi:hypothetical protein
VRDVREPLAVEHGALRALRPDTTARARRSTRRALRPCAGITSTQICCRCGVEDDLYAAGRCTACYLADEIARLRDTGNPETTRQLDGYLAALQAARPANSVLHWLRISRTSAAPVLRELIAGTRPITHRALDELEDSYAIQFHPGALVRHGAVPARDEVCHRFEQWITTTTTAVLANPDRSIVRRWAHWVVLHELRIRRGRTPTAADRGARTQVRAATHFATWLHQQHLSLAAARQEHLDRWLADGATTRNAIRRFIAWTTQARATPRLTAPPARSKQRGDLLPDEQRLAVITRLATDDSLELRTRVAGLLILLYGQPLARIIRIQLDDIQHHDEQTTLNLGRTGLLITEPIDGLLRTLAQHPEGSTLHDRAHPQWLFPGHTAGQPITEERLRRPLRAQLGSLAIWPGRAAAVRTLLRETPAPIVADLLGFSQHRTHQWSQLTGTNYANYVGLRQAAQHDNDAAATNDSDAAPHERDA